MEPYKVEANEDLSNIPALLMEDIIHELDKSDGWLILAKNFIDGTGRRVISDASLSEIRRAASPGRKVINILSRNLRKVHHLQQMLQHFHLYSVLTLINTNDPVRILEQEEDSVVDVSLGYRVCLCVRVEGSPYPSFQWYFEGSPISGATSHEFCLEHFSLCDAGEYVCRVRQSLNGAVSELTSNKYILKAKDMAPKILTDLNHMTIKAYTSLILSFEVFGHPEPRQFTWFKNNFKFITTEVPQLCIEAADVHCAGEYYCQVFNRAGFCTTSVVFVKVEKAVLYPSKPEILKEPRKHQICYVGDHINLFCEAVCSKPVTFTCFLNKHQLPGSSSLHDITISESKHHYRCELKYITNKEHIEQQDWKPLHFQFQVCSADGQVLSSEIEVKVKTKDTQAHFTARNKWALLIGNSQYHHKLGNLPASRNDMEIMKNRFVALKFRVMVNMDLKRSEVLNTVKMFSTFIQKGDYVSFYYAGHGIHSEGQDYIIPVDASLKYMIKKQNICLEKIRDVCISECISYVSVINELQKSEPALIFSIYDTCRALKPRFAGCQSNNTQERSLLAMQNSFFIFATSENYEAYESDLKNTSLLVNTLQDFMTCKLPVLELSRKVLERFDFPQGDKNYRTQVPKVCFDLAKDLSLADDSHPHLSDEEENGVLQRWERLGGVGGVTKDCIEMLDTKVKLKVQWNAVSRSEGVTWVISNCLAFTVSLSKESQTQTQDIDVTLVIPQLNATKFLKLKAHCSQEFIVPHLQDFQDHLMIELHMSYKGHFFEKRIYLESPAICQQYFKGNNIT